MTSKLSEEERIVASPLLPIEVTNIIRQRMRQEGLPLPEARQQLATFLAIPVTLRAPRTLYRRALEIAQEHDLPAAYDAHYVALAERLRCALWTDDQRLLRALGGRLAFVRPIVDYSPSWERKVSVSPNVFPGHAPARAMGRVARASAS